MLNAYKMLFLVLVILRVCRNYYDTSGSQYTCT